MEVRKPISGPRRAEPEIQPGTQVPVYLPYVASFCCSSLFVAMFLLSFRFLDKEMSYKAVVCSMFLQVYYSVSGQTKPLFPAFLIQPLGLLLLSKQSAKEPEGKWSVKCKFIHLKCGSWPCTIPLGKSLQRAHCQAWGLQKFAYHQLLPKLYSIQSNHFLWQLLAYVEQLCINMLEICVCVCVYQDEY